MTTRPAGNTSLDLPGSTQAAGAEGALIERIAEGPGVVDFVVRGEVVDDRAAGESLYEPPRVTPVANARELLAFVCCNEGQS